MFNETEYKTNSDSKNCDVCRKACVSNKYKKNSKNAFGKFVCSFSNITSFLSLLERFPTLEALTRISYHHRSFTLVISVR